MTRWPYVAVGRRPTQYLLKPTPCGVRGSNKAIAGGSILICSAVHRGVALHHHVTERITRSKNSASPFNVGLDIRQFKRKTVVIRRLHIASNKSDEDRAAMCTRHAFHFTEYSSDYSFLN